MHVIVYVVLIPWFPFCCRLLTANPDKLGNNLAQVRALLLGVGLSEKQISALVLRCPRAMLHNPVLLAIKLAGLKVRQQTVLLSHKWFVSLNPNLNHKFGP
jgi:hypothetical protein